MGIQKIKTEKIIDFFKSLSPRLMSLTVKKVEGVKRGASHSTRI